MYSFTYLIRKAYNLTHLIQKACECYSNVHGINFKLKQYIHFSHSLKEGHISTMQRSSQAITQTNSTNQSYIIHSLFTSAYIETPYLYSLTSSFLLKHAFHKQPPQKSHKHPNQTNIHFSLSVFPSVQIIGKTEGQEKPRKKRRK